MYCGVINVIFLSLTFIQSIDIIKIAEARNMKKSDFIFPKDQGSNFIFPTESKPNFHFPSHHSLRIQYDESKEYNFCKKNKKYKKLISEQECQPFANTKNGKWWKPEPDKTIDSETPDGYSGFNPKEWIDQVHAYDKNGERERRKSEIRYQAYINSIFGDGAYKENKILTPEQLNGREIADPGEFPHVAAVGIRLGRNNTDWKCSGSLLSELFVVTAAHCTNFGGESVNYVKIGDVNLNLREGVVATQRFNISQIMVHPDYKNELYYHDIALLKLSKPAVFTIYVHPIRIWPQREIPYDKAFGMGYGATEFGRVATGVLSFLNFTLIGNKQCNQTLLNMPETPFGIIDCQVCAVNTESSADLCQGDSGGPLQLHLPGLERPKYFLVGITSYGLVCGSRLPSVYTRVQNYLDWIEDIVWPD